jgi:hypothetical protein
MIRSSYLHAGMHTCMNDTNSLFYVLGLLLQAGLVQVGLWGGNAGSPWHMDNSSVRLVKITIYSSDVINSFSFHYQVDGKLHTAGPWGNASGTLHEVFAYR